MKRLLSPLMAILCASSAYAAAGTDTFGYESLGMSLENYCSTTVTGTETGAKYSVHNLYGWFTCYMKPADNAFVTVEESPGVIKSIYRDGGLGGTSIAVYGSSSPITQENIAEATLIGNIEAASILNVEGEYAYVALKNNLSSDVYFDALSFTWEEGGSEPPAPSDPTDHITATNLKSQNPDGLFNAASYDDHSAANPTMRYTGGSGAVYDFTLLISDGTWWTLDWPYPDPQGYMTTSTSGGYLKSVKFNMSWVPESMSFMVSQEPITPENRYDARQITLYRENGAIPEWTADGVYKYFYLNSAQEKIQDLAIEWTQEAPMVEAATPSISCYDYRIVPGSHVSVYTETPEATLHVDVYVNGEKHTGEGEATTSAVHEGSSYSFALPGKSGDTVKVDAYASKEGFVDSKTASQEFTLLMPQTARPECENYPSSVVPGQEVKIASATENATISYKYGLIDYDDNANNWTSEDLSGPSPVTVTVPQTAKEGLTFFIQATASADEYAESDRFELYTQVKSAKLPSPSFSIESGREVLAGTKLSITRPENATTIHYSVNGQNEQTSSGYSVEIVINDDITVEAWVSGEAPYIESDKATASYTVEKLNENQDAITPLLFTENIKNDSYADYSAKAKTTGYTYKYNGGLWPREETPCFYLDRNSDSGSQSILFNTEGREIRRVKLETAYGPSGCYIMFAKSPITEVTEEMKDYDYIQGRLRIINNDERADFGFDEWIDLSTLENEFQDCKYFAVWRFAQNSYVSRVVIEYKEENGIGSIGSDNDNTCRIFDLNGTEIRNTDSLRPGIYVRVASGKAEKIIIK